VADWPLPPYVEPRGPLGEDEDVVRAFARSELAPYSERFHTEGPVLLVGRDLPIVLRIGARSFLIQHDLSGDLAAAQDLVEEVFSAEGLSMLDEETLYGAAVGVQMVGLRYPTWDLWGADLDQGFADLRVAAAGGEEDLLFGGGGLPLAPE
jgi:hypothetical protein